MSEAAKNVEDADRLRGWGWTSVGSTRQAWVLWGTASALEWKERVASLRSQIAGQDGRLTAYQSVQESADAELRQSIARLEEKVESQGTEIAGIRQTLAAIQESIAGLQKGAQLHAKAIESIEAATSQTDEVVEHVVEAFGMVHRSMVERGEAKVLLVSRNGN